MADYVLSASLEIQDRFTAKISKATSKTHDFINKMKNFDDRLKKIESKMSNFAKKVNQTTNTADKLKNKLNGTQKEFKSFGENSKLKDFQKDMDKALEKIDQSKSKLEKLGDPLKKVYNNNSLDNFGKKVDKITNKINSSVSNLAKRTGKILKWGVIGGTGLGIGALKVGADFETLSGRMVTAFQGDQKKASEYLKWANEFANETPFSNEEVVDATIKLKSFKYDPKRMMTLLGDFAAAYGESLDRAIEAYSDAENGDFETLKSGFKIKRETVLDYAKNVLKDPIPMHGNEVANMDRFMKVLEIIMKERSKDGMKILKNTLNGMLSTATGTLKYSVAKLVGVTEEGHIRAGSLMDRVKEKFERLNNYMQSPEGQKALERWSKSFDDSLPQIIKLADTIKDKFKEIAGENFIERLNTSIANFDPSKFNTALDKIQKRMNFLMDTALRIGGALAGSKLGPLGTVVGFFTPEIIDAKNMVEEMKDDPNGEKAEKYKRTAGGGFFLKLMKHDEIMRQIQEQQETPKINFLQSFFDKQAEHERFMNDLQSPELRFKERIENVKTENQILNDYARENVIINNNNDNRVFNTTNNNYTENSKLYNSETKNNSFSSQNNIDNSKSSVSNNELSNVYNSEKSNDNSKNITNNEEISNAYNNSNINTNNNSKVYNTETRNNNNDLSKTYNSKTETNDNSKVYNSENNSKNIANSREVSNIYNNSSTNSTNDNSKVYNNNTETKEVKEKVRTLKQNITNNISIKIDGAITNKDDKVAYLDIANQLRDEIQKTIDKSFENMTTEIEFA